MTPHAQDVLSALTDEVLLRAARRNMLAVPNPGPAPATPPTDQDLLALMHGFRSVIAEVAEDGEKHPAEELFLDIVVPASLGQGQSLARLIGSASAFGIILMDEVRSALPAERREAAAQWLAAFFARYTAQLLRKATAL